MSVNKVILVGNVGQDPEVKTFEGGEVARITLATSETWKDKQGQKQEKTEWHELELWGGLAKVAGDYVKKGDKLYIEGSIKTDKWTDKEGNERKTTKIRVNKMTMLGSNNKNTENDKPFS